MCNWLKKIWIQLILLVYLKSFVVCWERQNREYPSWILSLAKGRAISGGVSACVDCTLHQCLQKCLNTLNCAGFDYDVMTDKDCLLHTEKNLCGNMVEYRGYTQFRRINCGTSRSYYMNSTATDTESDVSVIQRNLTSQAGTTIHYDITDIALSSSTLYEAVTLHYDHYPAPQGEYVAVRAPGPTKIPHGWHAYPGYQVLNVDGLVNNVGSGDACIKICELRADDCFGVEYQSIFKQCWIFNSNSSNSGCGSLIENRLVYHIKKSSCGSEYPTPAPIPGYSVV